MRFLFLVRRQTIPAQLLLSRLNHFESPSIQRAPAAFACLIMYIIGNIFLQKTRLIASQTLILDRIIEVFLYHACNERDYSVYCIYQNICRAASGAAADKRPAVSHGRFFAK